MIRRRPNAKSARVDRTQSLPYAEFSAEASTRRVAVLLPVLLDQCYDYSVPDGLEPEVGSFVEVPFGPQRRIGIVWPRGEGDGDGKPVASARLKPIGQLLDVPALPEVSLRFAEWIARYTLAPRGMVIRLMMSAGEVFEPTRPRFGLKLAGRVPDRMTPGREKVIAVARDGGVRTKAALAAEAGVGAGVVDGLVAAGALVAVEIAPARYRPPDPDHHVPSFDEDQAIAVETLRGAVEAGVFSVSLLDGVTGSGKTEVYFEAVAHALRAGRQVLVMLPEIALTGQFLARFEKRFGVRPVEWHSAVGAAERARLWRAVATGEARAVIGARSALFLPFTDLGLIVVDEEHDAGYKQDDRVNYQARDMAVVRASLGGAAVVLASATPSIESHVNARNGRYRHLRLTRRYNTAELPEITAIDLRREPPEKGSWLSPALVAALAETMAGRQQSLLFLNRRGYAPLTLCRACGHRVECPQCTAWLVEHRFRGRLICHHCGFSMPLPKACPNPKCDGEDTLVACGPGVERIAEEVAERFPQARVSLLSSDLIPGVKEMRRELDRIMCGEVDIIIGTQIVAKGHHFPGLATVGVVDGDLGLGQGDPRAAERTFQLLHQVTGRAGRESTSGRGFIQTHFPEHPVMAAILAGDREAFLEHEIAARQAALMPPFGRLAALVVSARAKPEAEGYAKAVVRAAPDSRHVLVLGPAEAPIAVVRGRYRFRILARAPRELDLQAYMRAWIERMPRAHGDIRLSIDIDPYNFL
ncbi:MAG: primosomal protein N' [Rhizobiales bacterium]|nr:primosomal protein N' [Hyphomicrobiales bacterium]